ncbi:MAG: UDP-glucose--hexose-1-phosphate uridylyltransferase [Oscillospiraceae bacterium]|nr:UDP-glucose--hexose-1-phosphate uridylyltransferase [Oscillospiraceae bacterium]
MIDKVIKELIIYAESKNLTEKEDRAYLVNRVLEVLKKEDYTDSPDNISLRPLEDILEDLISYAIEKGVIENSIVYKDLFSTKLMGVLTPRPSEVIRKFNNDYSVSPKKATDEFYKFCQDCDYIRAYRVKRDLKWKTATEYGDIDITINLSKPEKDPKAIAAAKLLPQSGYPKCQLCRENEGYSGRVNHPARQNHRIIPITINDSDWFLQYSPYSYYNEHCIVFNAEHTPMKIDRSAFKKLLDFTELFPHYFVGSNADLPIVGGSILSHDHFQGGNYEFPMARAEIETEITFKGFENIKAGIVRWPMSVIRLNGKNKEEVISLAEKILLSWRDYTDKEAFIFSETDGEKHNTITPIARRRGESFELDLVLRNNITTEEHPLGVYHPHKELHHIKKENIGLIEVMGLAVLPARLKGEIAEIKRCILEKEDISSNEKISAHADWVKEIKEKYEDINKENIDKIIEDEIGLVFSEVLSHAGVYKRTAEGKKAFMKFISNIE